MKIQEKPVRYDRLSNDEFSIAISVAAGNIKITDIKCNNTIARLITKLTVLFDSGKLDKYFIHGSVNDIRDYVKSILRENE